MKKPKAGDVVVTFRVNLSALERLAPSPAISPRDTAAILFTEALRCDASITKRKLLISDEAVGDLKIAINDVEISL